MEIERRQLIDDDTHGDILSLPRIHTGHEAVQDKGVQRPDDTLHLRVVRYQQIARILRVAHLQVEVVAVPVEYPIALFGRQTRSIDTQRTDHTLKLFHRLVLECCLERAEQRGHLVVRFQHLENGLVALVQERQDMRHIRVFA